MTQEYSSEERHHVSVRQDLSHPSMGVMDFLNEAAERYPDAISLAAGRPPDQFVSTEATARWMSRYVHERARAGGMREEAVWRSLGQYGPSRGIINDLVARLLERDEGIRPDPGDVMISNGMQEALFLLLLCICDEPSDVLIVDDPTYTGVTGAALLARVATYQLEGDGSFVSRTARAIEQNRRAGRFARAIYVVSDFSNPMGTSLSLVERRELLELARRERLLVIEDTAYRAFRYEGEELPSLKALDQAGVVVQLGSFSKLFMPGPRIGFVVAGQKVGRGARDCSLIDELGKAKSFVSVMTSPQVQASVGGFLFERDFSLKQWNEPRVAACRLNRDALLDALNEILGQDPILGGRVSWSRPEGGFFLVLTLPLQFGTTEMMQCARDYGVIATPMGYFSATAKFANCLRLSFSNARPPLAREGVARLQRFLRERMARQAC